MFGTYLLTALHTLTQGYDFWCNAFIRCENYIGNLKERLEKDNAEERHQTLICLSQLFQDRLSGRPLWRTIACSKTFRGNFLIDSKTSLDDIHPLFCPNNLGSSVHRDPKAAQLLCILQTMLEEDECQAVCDIPTLMDEIFSLVQSHRGGQWPTKFAGQMTEEVYDASCALEACNKMREAERIPENWSVTNWDSYKKHSNKLLQIDPRGDAITSILTRHMVPRPDLKFQYVGSTSTSAP